MFNEVAIKEANLTWLKTLLFDHNDYNDDDFYTAGDWGEKMKYPGMVVSIAKEAPVTGIASGTIDIDFVTEDRTVIYISDFTIRVDIYAQNDEEANSIASYIMGKMRETRSLPTSESVNINRRFDNIIKINPEKREGDHAKGWVASLYYDIRVGKQSIIRGGIFNVESS